MSGLDLGGIFLYDRGALPRLNSVWFVALFSLFYTVYAAVLRRVAVRNALLLGFSLFFYYKLAGPGLAVLLFIAGSDFLFGRQIARTADPGRRDRLLVLALLVDLATLGLFKYASFTLGIVASVSGVARSASLLELVAPIGMSFYVFRSMSYLLDLHRETLEEPETSFLRYLLFVSFFPVILAGPISKARDLLPQLREETEPSREEMTRGFVLVLCGLVKKVAIGDFLAANLVDRTFSAQRFATGFENLMAGYGSYVQIYCDFSGYTDIVLGLALLMGFRLAPNFDRPFLAKSFTDFWRRWHITLSDWLKEYLFLPISFVLRKRGKWGVALAVFLTFLLSGLWHGPSWTFILWGAFHGLAIGFDVLTSDVRRRIEGSRFRRPFALFATLVTFQLISLSILLFSSPDLRTAAEIYGKLFDSLEPGLAMRWLGTYRSCLVAMLAATTLQLTWPLFGEKLVRRVTPIPWPGKAVLLALALLGLYRLANVEPIPFVYLKF